MREIIRDLMRHLSPRMIARKKQLARRVILEEIACNIIMNMFGKIILIMNLLL